MSSYLFLLSPDYLSSNSRLQECRDHMDTNVVTEANKVLGELSVNFPEKGTGVRATRVESHNRLRGAKGLPKYPLVHRSFSL